MRSIIALSGRAGSGKSEVAHYLKKHGWQPTKFAVPLKAMFRALGLNEREIEGDLKEAPCAKLGGKTPRWAMQSLGTEWGRYLISRDLWINAWRDSLPATGPVVVDDCRFENEAGIVRSLGGIIVEVRRALIVKRAGSHISEDVPLNPDVVLWNDGSLDDLYHQVDGLVRDLSWARAA